MPLGFHLPFFVSADLWRVAAPATRDRLLTQALAGL
jgi:hypothetical protein